jgi:photosystem II stability/assembly factor-like uncharacterized protein
MSDHASIARLALAVTAVLALTGQPSLAAEALNLDELARATHFHGLAVDPADPSRLYLATHHGFFVVSADGSAAEVSTVAHDFMGFTPHPADRTVLYASGHPKGGGNLGFVVSEDGGRSWRKLADGVGGPVDFHQMDISRADPKVIYGVFRDLQRSDDGGRTWRNVGPAPERLFDLAVGAAGADTLYAATESGLLRSTDGGRSWQRAHPAAAPATMVHVADGGTVYAHILGQGLLRASEAGLDWRQLNAMRDGRYLLHFAVDPTDERTLYAVAHDPASRKQALIVSRDGGATWRALGG